MSIALFFGELWGGFQLVLERSADILEQPFLSTDMLWILLPLLATLFLIELYFGRYRKESLGWNSAVGNSLVLFFVAVNLFSYLYRNQLLITVSLIPQGMFLTALAKSLITFFIILESILLLVLNFFHLMPRNMAFGVSSVLMINFIGVIAIIHVYSETLPFDIIALLASLVIFIALAVAFKGLQLMMPKASEEEKKVEDEEE
jgi:hypothetical protein